MALIHVALHFSVNAAGENWPEFVQLTFCTLLVEFLICGGFCMLQVFRPQNPWTMAIMNVLAELHQEHDLKVSVC